MKETNTSRREAMTLLSGVPLAVGLLAASDGPAEAFQGNMERALSALSDARDFLHAATSNKGGHKARAVRLIGAAMDEVRAGIDFANAHGGGGRY